MEEAAGHVLEVKSGSLPSDFQKPPYYLEPALKADLDKLKKLVLDGSDEDAVIVIDGRERAGKSVLAMQIAKYLDPSFNMSRLCFSTSEFVKAIRENTRKAIVFDESIVGLHSSRSMERQTIFIDELLAMSGQKNLFTIIVVPFFFELTKRTAIGRSEFLIHVFRMDYKRGHFRVYDYKTKKKMYILGKRLMDYNVKGVAPGYHGYFSNKYVVNESKYRQKKAEALNSFARRFSETVEFKTAVRWIQMARLLELEWLNQLKLLKNGAMTKRAGMVDLTPNALYHAVQQAKNEVESFGLAQIFGPLRPRRWHEASLELPAGVTSFEGGNEGKDDAEGGGGEHKKSESSINSEAAADAKAAQENNQDGP